MHRRPVLTQLSLCGLVLSAVLVFLVFATLRLFCAGGGSSCAGGWFCSLCVVEVLAAVVLWMQMLLSEHNSSISQYAVDFVTMMQTNKNDETSVRKERGRQCRMQRHRQ